MIPGMPGGKFNLLDPAYWEALCDAVEGLERAGIDCVVVGGSAVQVWMAVLYTSSGELSITDVSELEYMLRSTRDVDLSARAKPEEALSAWNRLAATARPPAEVLSPRAARLRKISLNLTLEPQDVTGFAELYDVILERATRVQLRRQNRWLYLKVASLEDLFGTKLTRKGNQAKDLVDLDNLCASLSSAGQKVQLAPVREYLDEQGLALLNAQVERYPEVFDA